MHAVLVCLALGAPPGEVVQTLDLGRLSWQRAWALRGSTVRVRFTVEDIVGLDGPAENPVVVVRVVAPQNECRYITMKRSAPALTRGALLEAEGVLRVEWRRKWPRTPGYPVVALDHPRLVK